MFLISRDTETAAAAASPTQATAEVSPVNSPAIEEAKADVPTAPEVVAPAPAPLPEVAPPVQTKPVVHHKTKKLTAKPRRDASHDPNGTVDPYL
jgi:hypothetical protein